MPDRLPLFPLETVLFPDMVLPLHVFEPRYRKLFAERSDCDPTFGVVLAQSGREVGEQPDIHEVGTAATLLEAIKYADGRVDLAVRGGHRFRVLEGNWDASCLVAELEWLPDVAAEAPRDKAIRLAEDVKRAFAAYLDAVERAAGQAIAPLEFGGGPAAVAYAVCAAMPFGTAERQRLLEASDLRLLLDELLLVLRRERDLLLATGIGGAAISHPGRRFSTN